jgi:hypothetical protein
VTRSSARAGLLPEPPVKAFIAESTQAFIETLFDTILTPEIRAAAEAVVAHAEGDELPMRELVEERVGSMSLVEKRAEKKADSLFKRQLKDYLTDGKSLPVPVLLWLLEHHRERLERKGDSARLQEQVRELRSGIKRFPSVELALNGLALEGQNEDEVLEEMIPGVAYVEQENLLPGDNLAGKVASQIRREGMERSDKPGMVFAPGPEHLLEHALEHAHELELAAFANHELLARKIHDSELSSREYESFVFGTLLGNKEAAEVLGRPANQIGQEKFRAINKLRPPA